LATITAAFLLVGPSTDVSEYRTLIEYV